VEGRAQFSKLQTATKLPAKSMTGSAFSTGVHPGLLSSMINQQIFIPDVYHFFVVVFMLKL